MAWLADRLKTQQRVVLRGAYDALSARMLEAAGETAIYCSGFSTCASAFGLPDLGLVTATEMLDHFRRIRAVTAAPMLVDADTGYGEAQNVERTIVNLAAIGVGACHIEDQTFPKRCGHMEGKSVVSRESAIERVKVAVTVGRQHGVDIIARTDALATDGLDEAIIRANEFIACGAVAAFIDAPRNDDDLRMMLRDADGPLVFNAAPTGIYQAPYELQCEFHIVLHPIEALLKAFSALEQCFGLSERNGEISEKEFHRIQKYIQH